MSSHYSSQIKALLLAAVINSFWAIWYACNQVAFKNKSVLIFATIRSILRAIKECNLFKVGHMKNTKQELLILRQFGVAATPNTASKLILVRRCPPQLS